MIVKNPRIGLELDCDEEAQLTFLCFMPSSLIRIDQKVACTVNLRVYGIFLGTANTG